MLSSRTDTSTASAYDAIQASVATGTVSSAVPSASAGLAAPRRNEPTSSSAGSAVTADRADSPNDVTPYASDQRRERGGRAFGQRCDDLPSFIAGTPDQRWPVGT